MSIHAALGLNWPGQRSEPPKGTALLRCLSENQLVIDDHRRTAAIVAEIASKEARPKSEPRHSSWADYSRAWRARRPKRGRRSDWIWGHPTYSRPISKEQRREILKRAHSFNRANRQPGRPFGPLGAKGIDVLAAVLIIQEREFGVCCPSHAEIAKEARCSTSTVYHALIALQRAGFLQIVPRRERARRPDGRVAPMVRSNAYLFPDAGSLETSPELDNRSANRRQFFKTHVESRRQSKNAASAWSADLRSPAATAPSLIYLPPGVEPPF